MSKSGATVYPHLLEAGQLFSELAKAFESGTYEGLHRFAETSDLFERLAEGECSHCGHADVTSMAGLTKLFGTLMSTRDGVLQAKAHRSAA